jgi:hypothetical protein
MSDDLDKKQEELKKIQEELKETGLSRRRFLDRLKVQVSASEPRLFSARTMPTPATRPML